MKMTATKLMSKKFKGHVLDRRLAAAPLATKRDDKALTTLPTHDGSAESSRKIRPTQPIVRNSLDRSVLREFDRHQPSDGAPFRRFHCSASRSRTVHGQ